MGKNAKPILILSKDERINPWGKRTTITEDMLNKKGMLELISMGLITKNANCT